MNPKYKENMDAYCGVNGDRTPAHGQYCQFKVEWLGNCSPNATDSQYGLPQRQPCIFLTLNKVPKSNWPFTKQ